jgi:4'-phosphopantetheinyl transferase
MSVCVVLMRTSHLAPADVAAAMVDLPGDEQEKAAAFRFFRDRRDYVMAHAVLRRELARALKQPPHAIHLTQDAKGKPMLEAAGPFFNLSHCDGLVAVAVGAGPVGVDVETIGPDPLPDIWDQVLHPEEQDWLRAQPELEQPAAFRRFWTLKEAVLKADGIALQQDLRDLCFRFDPICLRVADKAQIAPHRWAFAQRRLETQHIAALAFERGATVSWRIEQGAA